VKHRGRTVLAMDCALAGAETHRGRPLNAIVMRRRLSIVGTELSLPFGHCADQADEEQTITSA
jgi:hypothetical protein